MWYPSPSARLGMTSLGDGKTEGPHSRPDEPRARKEAMTTKAQFPEEQSEDGEFERQEDAFRDWVSADGSTPYPAVAGRYHLYVSLACPWASRTLIVRRLQRTRRT